MHGKVPWSFLQYRENSELDKSASEDKDPKKLNIWCTKSIFICLIAVSGTLPSTVCQVQLLHLRESPCFSWEFLHQGLHMDFTLNSYWVKDKQCLDWGLELRPLFFLRGLPSCVTTEACFYFSICFGPQTSDFSSTKWHFVWLRQWKADPLLQFPVPANTRGSSMHFFEFASCGLASFQNYVVEDPYLQLQILDVWGKGGTGW